MRFHQNGLFCVTDQFYKKLLKPPQSRKYNNGNAYIFGKKYPTKEYKFIASHGNDAAQTGLIDVELWKKGDYEKNSQKIDNVNAKFGYRYDHPRNVEIVRKISGGAVLFQGETVGGDVGAGLYAHYNSGGNIDSLIIDNNYFFKEQS